MSPPKRSFPTALTSTPPESHPELLRASDFTGGPNLLHHAGSRTGLGDPRRAQQVRRSYSPAASPTLSTAPSGAYIHFTFDDAIPDGALACVAGRHFENCTRGDGVTIVSNVEGRRCSR